MMFNATFNNISDISWRSVLLVEETGVPGENHGPASIYLLDCRYYIYIYLYTMYSQYIKFFNIIFFSICLI